MLLLVFSVGVGATGFDGNRYALVVGNAHYKNSPLKNPINDAVDVASALKSVGFRVQLLKDATRREIHSAIHKFSQKLTRNDVGLYYFSGHALQYKGNNYLIPIGADVPAAYMLEGEAVALETVLDAMEESGSRLKIVILDACRSNPYRSYTRSGSQGLAVTDAPKGTFIAYSTAPGSVAADGVGRNSPYTKHLITAIQIPNLLIEQAFKQVRIGVTNESGGEQVPWEESSLMGDFYFNGKPANIATVAPIVSDDAATVATVARPVEAIRWGDGTYTGQLLNAVPHGRGTWSHPSGEHYVGSWYQGTMHGEGTYVYDNGDKYVGGFKDHLSHGQGTYTFGQAEFEGDQYVGEFKNDKRDGQGTYTHANGNKHVGEYRNGKEHGRGTYIYTNGETYVGEYRNGNANGQGIYTWPSGNKYVGEFRDGEIWLGVKYDNDGNVLATYSDGVRNPGN